jgi:hypothetical protein
MADHATAGRGHKDVLSQADILIAMKLTASQDRDAIGAWIEGQADRHGDPRRHHVAPRARWTEARPVGPKPDRARRKITNDE